MAVGIPKCVEESHLCRPLLPGDVMVARLKTAAPLDPPVSISFVTAKTIVR